MSDFNGFMPSGFVLVVALFAFILFIFSWVFTTLKLMRFCSMCGHPHAGLVWVPLPGVSTGITLQSMSLLGTGTLPYNLAGILGWVCAGCSVLTFIPFVGFVTGAA
ncbi:MAG: hypothetical protein NC131_17040, partial [Roseburia sp.]|nr:hypothetical protein [Roseburia sp.]